MARYRTKGKGREREREGGVIILICSLYFHSMYSRYNISLIFSLILLFDYLYLNSFSLSNLLPQFCSCQSLISLSPSHQFISSFIIIYFSLSVYISFYISLYLFLSYCSHSFPIINNTTQKQVVKLNLP